MAQAAETLDKTTPESKWKEILSADEVRLCTYDCFTLSRSFSLRHCHINFHCCSHTFVSQYYILRGKGTEGPGTGVYNKHKEEGIYNCAGCGSELYKCAQD